MALDTGPMDTHKVDQMYENIMFLRYECGLHESLAAKRLGITVSNLRQIVRRKQGE